MLNEGNKNQEEVMMQTQIHADLKVLIEQLPEDQKEVLVAQIPMGRLGTVNEVAQAVLFLAGDSGAYITAQTLHVNGGMYTV